MNDPLTIAHSHLEETFRISSDLQSMLAAIPPYVNNHRDAVTQWLIVQGHWSIPDIVQAVPWIIEERARCQ